MSIFRGERACGFTVMSNHHLRDLELSLKAKGLLSVMLSLPEGWNYSVRGLAAICREGPGAITTALRELEAAGYVTRRQLRDRTGRICDTAYTICEEPQPETPQPEDPDVEAPQPENPPESKKEETNTQRTRKERSNTHRIVSDPAGDADGAAIRAQILENVEYPRLCRQYPSRREELDELVELMVETVCARRSTIRIAGSHLPYELVRSRFLKLEEPHLEFVLDALGTSTAAVRNPKQYLLSVLFNAPATMANHYAARVNHDLSLPPEREAAGFCPGA